MNKDEILAKSRAENKNKDIYEQEILKQTNTYAIITLMTLATIFFVIQICVGGGINYGIYAIISSGNMTTSWMKYIKLKQQKQLLIAILYTLLTLALSGCYIYNLITSSKII